MKHENKKSPNINEKFADNKFIKEMFGGYRKYKLYSGVFIGKESNECEIKLIDFNNNVGTNYLTLGRTGTGMNWSIKRKMIKG